MNELEHGHRESERLHAIALGPVKNLLQVRSARHGSVFVRGRSIRHVGNDGKAIAISLGSSGDLRRLAEALLAAADQVDESAARCGR